MTSSIIRIVLLLVLASESNCSIKVHKEQWCVTKADKDVACVTVYVPYRHCAP